MTGRKTSLSAALHEAAGHQPAQEVAAVERVTKPIPAQQSPSRRGLKVVSGHFDPAVSKQLWQLVIEQDRDSIQEMLAEAINDLFIKYKKNPIA